MAPSVEVRSPSPGTARAIANVPMDVEIDLELPLHFLAASDSIQALEAAKRILDAQTHSINAHEPDCGLTPLHIAASWGNLGMCQLLFHYGADITAVDEDGNTCVDMVQSDSPQIAKFFKKIVSNDAPQQRRLKKVLNRVFGWPKHLRREAALRQAKKKAEGARKKKTRPASCSSKFAEVGEAPLVKEEVKSDVRRRSSHLKQQPTDNDIAQVMDALSVQPVLRGSQGGVPKTPVKSVQPEGAEETKLKPTHSEAVLPLTPTKPVLPRSSSDLMETPTTSKRLYPDLPRLMNGMDLSRPLPPLPPAETPPPIPPQRCHSKFTRTPTAPPLSDENTPETTPERDPEIRRLTISQLRSRLISAGISPGPLGKENRTLYEKKLISVEKQKVASYSNAVFSAALDRAIRQSVEGLPKSDVGQIQEDIIRNEFCLGPS
uniref:LEM domain-containing protein n=1 Tax=Panagrellus redivivus TaxID=6233 RepID=A0A7E4V4K7_PANRE